MNDNQLAKIAKDEKTNIFGTTWTRKMDIDITGEQNTGLDIGHGPIKRRRRRRNVLQYLSTLSSN